MTCKAFRTLTCPGTKAAAKAEDEAEADTAAHAEVSNPITRPVLLPNVNPMLYIQYASQYTDANTYSSFKTKKKKSPLSIDFYSRNLYFFLIVLFFQLSKENLHVSAQIACESTSDCRQALSISGISECVGGFCTNPFSQGCLRIMDHEKGGLSLTEEPKFNQRVCNSDDVAANDFSNCRQPDSIFATYKEVRIGAGDWESSIFLAWILQIMLGELLQVPVTVETSSPRSIGSASFYDVESSMVYPAVPYNYQALKRATELDGDCTKADLDSGADTCAHLLPEVWSGQINAYNDALEQGFIEPPEGNGMVGKFNFMIPRLTAEKDPTLTSWHGLKDRRKMAETFLRPTSWVDYCNEVSVNNCTQADGTADRYPQTPDEQSSYFLPGLYTGHFRSTDKNNCTMYPDTCTGHVVDPPCEWDTLTESQMYWNNIPLASDGPLHPNGGYPYFQMLEIWHAANATRSPVFFWWWKPDSLDQLYADTDYALQPIFLPPPTEECEKNRVTNVERCSDNLEDRLGQPIGSCEAPAHALQKIISTSLFTSTFAQPEAIRSPAYEFIKRFRVSDLSLTIMLRNWIHTRVDTYGIDPRIAVCEWVYDNLDALQAKFVPPGYPRIFKESISKPMVYASFSLGFLALAMAIFATIGTLKHQNSLIFKYAHVPFVLWILFGLVMVCTGSILVAPKPSNGLCMAQPFLITLGYTIELMPLVFKVSAINHLIHETKRMRKVRIDTNRLHLQVGGVTACVFIYLIIWTILDAQVLVETAHLVEQGEAEVNISTSCQSSTHVWVIVTYIWQGFLLLSALVLAVQSRNVKQEFNESQSLAFMVYSHTLFLILRALVYALPPENFSSSNLQSGIISICLSLDSINTMIVYFAPKFYAIAKKQDVRSPDRVSIYTAQQSGTGDRRSKINSGFMSENRAFSTNSVDYFDEPPPQEDEMKRLMGEACDLLVQAAVEHDKQFDKTKSVSPRNSQEDNNDNGNDEKKDRKKENHYMTQDELLLLRAICARISRAKFDFEKERYTAGQINKQVVPSNSSSSSIVHTAPPGSEHGVEIINKTAPANSVSNARSRPASKAVSWAEAELPFSSVAPTSEMETVDATDIDEERKVSTSEKDENSLLMESAPEKAGDGSIV